MVLIGAVGCGLKLEAMADDTILTATNVLLLIGGVAAVHLSALWLGLRSSRALGFAEPDSIAVAFAGSQKTLMVGAYVALAVGPLAILPMVAYHAMQLFVDTLIADRWAQQNADTGR
jgi:sodium/bile acid cotransporter 7